MGCVSGDLAANSSGWCVSMGNWVAECQSQGSSVLSTSAAKCKGWIHGGLEKNKSQVSGSYK